jgi:O-antigen/teichoic acid export membrane protein
LGVAIRLPEGLYYKSSRYVLLINVSLAALLIAFSRELLSYWISPEFAHASSAVLVLTAAAVAIESLTIVPSLVIDGLGKPKITALFVSLGVILGLVSIYVGTKVAGIVGAAAGHFVSVCVTSFGFIAYVHGRAIPFKLGAVVRSAYVPVYLPIGLLLTLTELTRPSQVLALPAAALAISIFCLGLLAIAAFVVTDKERKRLFSGLRRSFGLRLYR